MLASSSVAAGQLCRVFSTRGKRGTAARVNEDATTLSRKWLLMLPQPLADGYVCRRFGTQVFDVHSREHVAPAGLRVRLDEGGEARVQPDWARAADGCHCSRAFSGLPSAPRFAGEGCPSLWPASWRVMTHH